MRLRLTALRTDMPVKRVLTGARGKGGGETDKQQPSEEHTKNPDKAVRTWQLRFALQQS